MGRGHGRVARGLIGLFDDQQHEVFSTGELCRIVFGVSHVEKRHRVSLLRTLKRLAKKELKFVRRRIQQHEKADDLWFDGRVWPLPGSIPVDVPRRS